MDIKGLNGFCPELRMENWRSYTNTPMRNATVTFTLFAALSAFAADVKHPWASFKPGSYAKMKTTTMAGPSKTTTEMTQTLVSVDANNAVVETETKAMGQTMKNKMNIPLKATGTATPTQAKAPVMVNETITVAGKALACKCFETESNQNGMKTTTKACTSDAVPGGAVRMTSKSTGAVKMETVTELVEFAAK
jgi:hypothetical protein